MSHNYYALPVWVAMLYVVKYFWCSYVYNYVYVYNLWCMYVVVYVYIFSISLARKNGLGRLPEHNHQSINQSTTVPAATAVKILTKIFLS